MVIRKYRIATGTMTSVRPTESRPAWQQPYLLGTLVIWPPDHVRQVVNPLRHRYDPASQATCEAHITLTHPFLRKPGQEEWNQIQPILERFPSFQMRYGPLNTFLPYPCVWFEVQPVKQILELRDALHASGLFNLDLPHTEDFTPHMTITEGFSGPEVTLALFEELRETVSGGSFSCTAISYIRPDEAFSFLVERQLPLGHPSGTDPELR